MFNRVGAKLKSLAEVLSFLGICAMIIWGGITIDGGVYRGMVHGPTLVLGLCIAIGGSIAVWLVCLFIYGFGQLIENTDRIPYPPKSRICCKLATKEDAEEVTEKLMKSNLASESLKKEVAEVSEEVAEKGTEITEKSEE